MANIKKNKNKGNVLFIKKKKFRRINYKKNFYVSPNIKCSTNIALISKNNFLLKKKQMELILFRLNQLLKNSLINIYGNIYFNKTFTLKAKQSRMGKGKAEVVDLFGTVGKFEPVFEFFFNIKEKKIKKKKIRKLLKNKIRLRDFNNKLYRFDRNLNIIYKIFRLKKIIDKKKKKNIFYLNKNKLKFILKLYLYYFNLYFEENCIYELLNDLFFLYNKKLENYFSFVSKMNFYFIEKNKFSSFDSFFLFFYRYNLLCRSLINFFFKYKFGISLLVFPLEYENLFNGRNKNFFIGRR